VIYEFPDDMIEAEAYLDPANWYITNPNMDRSVDRVFLADELAKAKRGEVGALQTFYAKHLNVPIGGKVGSWRGSFYWAAAKAEFVLTIDELLARSEVVTVGADGGGLDDLFGLAVLGREREKRIDPETGKETQRWLLWVRAWVDKAVLELRKDIAEQLQLFAEDGDLVICEIGTEDLEEIAEIVARIHHRGLLPDDNGVGLDPVGIAVLLDALSARGVESKANGGPVVSVAQGYRLNGAIKGMERRLKDRSLLHGGQALAAWCVGNAQPVMRGSAVMIDKETAGSAKIDPLVAAFNAYQLMSLNPAARVGPVYPVPLNDILASA
jgi:phage terminase large subunit-like protein